MPMICFHMFPNCYPAVASFVSVEEKWACIELVVSRTNIDVLANRCIRMFPRNLDNIFSPKLKVRQEYSTICFWIFSQCFVIVKLCFRLKYLKQIQLEPPIVCDFLDATLNELLLHQTKFLVFKPEVHANQIR